MMSLTVLIRPVIFCVVTSPQTTLKKPQGFGACGDVTIDAITRLRKLIVKPPE
jgi:hypothetical protein